MSSSVRVSYFPTTAQTPHLKCFHAPLHKITKSCFLSYVLHPHNGLRYPYLIIEFHFLKQYIQLVTVLCKSYLLSISKVCIFSVTKVHWSFLIMPRFCLRFIWFSLSLICLLRLSIFSFTSRVRINTLNLIYFFSLWSF